MQNYWNPILIENENLKKFMNKNQIEYEMKLKVELLFIIFIGSSRRSFSDFLL